MRASLGVRSKNRRHRLVSVVCVLVIIALLAGFISLIWGSYTVSVSQLLDIVNGRGARTTEHVIFFLRLPRWITGALVGVALAVSGAITQTLSGNPLGSPDFMGFTNGAATGGIVTLLLLNGNNVELAIGALVGGFLAVITLALLSTRLATHQSRWILIGVGLNAILLSINSYLISRAELRDAVAGQAWLTGSLNGRGWEQVISLACVLLLCTPIIIAYRNQLSIMELGGDISRGLGVNVARSRLVLLVISVTLTAVAVACAGPIAFVALIAPQIAQRLTGSTSPSLVVSGITGAVLTTVSDIIAQHIFAPVSLPVGIATAALGGIYLCWLVVGTSFGVRNKPARTSYSG